MMLHSEDYNMMSKSMLIALAKEQAKELNDVSNKLKEALSLNDIYRETIASLNLQIYGSKSEKRKPITEPLPPNTFNEAEAIADPEAVDANVEEIEKKRNRVPREKGKRERDLSRLEVEEVIHDARIEQGDCSECGGTLRFVSNESRDEIIVQPRRVYIRRHITPVYVCDECEKQGEKANFIKALTPKPVIPNSGLASASLIVNIVFNKFFMGLPLYRQEKEFKLTDIPISRQNMANWVIYTSVRYFKPMFELMQEDLVASYSIHCDETPVRVLKEPQRPNKRTRNSKSYFWEFRTGRSERKQIILFKYSYSRAKGVPEEFLKGFHSYAHVDGYEAYHSIDGIIWVGCWSHLRRMLMDIYKLIPEKSRNQEPLTLCEEGLNLIDKLFEIEREIADLPYEDIHEERQKRSLPIIDKFISWVHDNKDNATPESKIGKAFTYAINQEEYLRRYLLDGRLEISNNRAERTIRNVTVSRRNWLFCDTDNGAEASAIYYSFVTTAQDNSLNLTKYIEFVLDELAQIPLNESTPDLYRKYLSYSDFITSNPELSVPVSDTPVEL